MIDIEDIKKLRQERGMLATNQQIMAANPQNTIWVEASAGTGKTKVLSDRVLRLLLNNVNPIRILCLTYTKAAAVEMNTRISERLSKWSIISDDKLEKDLYSLLGDEINSIDDLKRYKQTARTLFAILLDTPGGIKIQTIHSFCQEVLKRFPLEAGISPYFNVLEDIGRMEVLSRIQKELINEAQNNSSSEISIALQYLIDNISEFKFPKIMDSIIINRTKIADLLRKYNNFNDFCKNLSQKIGISDDETEESLIASFMKNICISDLRANIKAWLCGTPTDIEKAEKLEIILNKGISVDDYDYYKGLHLSRKNEGLSDKKLATKSAQLSDNNILNRLHNEIERLLILEEKIKKAHLYQSSKAMFTIANDFINRYTEYKQQNSILDFDDLVLITRDLLSNNSVASWVLFKLDGGIDHILVDEAQDTSPNQWEIIKSLSSEFFAGEGANERNRTVFVVGDRKQSIYSFQGADPDKFDIMSEYFAQKAASSFKRVNLAVSFRSSAAILEMVNQLFSSDEISKGVVAKGEKVNHIPFRTGEYGKVELWPLFIADKKENKAEYWLPPVEMSSETSIKSKIAKAVAERIQQMVTNSQSSSNPLTYRDFMVLVQLRRNFVDEFVRACKDIGVNVSGADKLKLTDQIVVHDLISLGKFLLLPNDCLSLAEILKSPLFGLNDDDLIELCYNRGDALLWSRLGNNHKYIDIYKQLQQLLDMTDNVRPYELYNYVLTKMNGRYKFIERMGIEIEDALDEFINLTISYERENIPTLQGFISWIDSSSVEVKRETEQKDNNAVRIMTVHGSKGLQAPIVFLPDTVHCKTSKSEQALLWDNNMAYYPLNKDSYDEICNRIKQENYQKSLEEYRRLLYVALTRAEDRLIICGYSNSEDINEQSWYKMCSECLKLNGVEEGDNFINEVPELISKKIDIRSQNKILQYETEDWIYQNAKEEDLLSKPYTPSKIEDEEDIDSSSPLSEEGNYYRRGFLIHKLLQFLPRNKLERDKIIDEFLYKNANEFSDYQKKQIKKEVLSLINNPEFTEIFGENSFSEVPVFGEVEGKIISAQMDKLVILPEKIMIIDYKTNRPAAQTLDQTPKNYIIQLDTYAKLIKKIYPNKLIETYILWTNETRLMRVS